MTEHSNPDPAHQAPPPPAQGSIYTPPSSPAPPARRGPGRWLWPTVTGFVALIAGIGIGGAGDPAEPEAQTVTVDANSEQQEALDDRAAELDDREADLNEYERSLDKRDAELRHEEQQAAANTIGNGIWTVGVDIEPGTYRASDVSSDCYWAILVTGTNGADIVSNGIPGGGNPEVTLEEGHDFETNRCGEWTKQ